VQSERCVTRGRLLTFPHTQPLKGPRARPIPGRTRHNPCPRLFVDNERPYVLLAVLSFLAIAATLAAGWLALRLRNLKAALALPARGSQQPYDTLTGLPTRITIVASAEKTIAEATRAGAPFAVTVLNVNRFKSINDSLGHEVGDELLQMLSQRLGGVLVRGDLLGRLAGDEFVVLSRVGAGAIPAEVTIETIFAALREPFSIGGHDIEVAVTAGISMFPSMARRLTCCCDGPKPRCARPAALRAAASASTPKR
jgi:diguanylate cyclase (GGDEF)-like protein